MAIRLSFIAAFALLSTQPVPASAHDRPTEGLGKVHFATSCDPRVEERFDRAMLMLHSFWAKDAIAGFKALLEDDPRCAMAYWGIAMAHQQNPLTAQAPTSDALKESLAALDKAEAIPPQTPREADYVRAIGAIYRHADTVDFPTRRRAYEKAMEALAARYPDDPEAQIFYALSLDMTASLADKTYANQLKAAAILERVLEKEPEHPGVAHYLIHSYDYPPIAQRGVRAARLYAKLAPNHPHGLHMPSHIFTRLGMWRESIESNVRSAAAARDEGNGQEQAHAMDYLVYAYLQLGDTEKARSVVAESRSLNVNPKIFIGPFAQSAMPARFAVERRAWPEAAALEVRETGFFFPDANTHFARGLGFAHLGRIEAARSESERLAALRDALAAKNEAYWSKQVEVQRLAVDAWTALAAGARDEALAKMQSAADLEDSMDKHIVTPGAIVPARELLGDMLLALDQPSRAVAAYEASARREPMRKNGIEGLSRAKSALASYSAAAQARRP